MDNFVIDDLPGVKQIKLNCFFTEQYLNMDNMNKRGYPVSHQRITGCIIRHNRKILGTGITICHPDDEQDAIKGKREAVKVASEAVSYSIYLDMLNSHEMEVTDPIDVRKAIFRARRKMMRVQKEEENE